MIISKDLESCSITVELLTQQYFVVAIVILLFVSLIFLLYLLACVCVFKEHFCSAVAVKEWEYGNS